MGSFVFVGVTLASIPSALWSLQYCVNALINFIPFLVDPRAVSHSNQWCDGSCAVLCLLE